MSWLGGSRTISGGAGGPSFQHIVSRIVTGKTPQDGAINEAKLADESVTTAKLADGAVTAAKVDASVATREQLDSAVEGAVAVGLKATGSSTMSGTAVVCSLEAGEGKKLIAASILAIPAGTSGRVGVRVTYTDATTTEATERATEIVGNDGGLHNGPNYTPLETAKDIKKIEVLTSASDAGTRAGSLSALEVAA